VPRQRVRRRISRRRLFSEAIVWSARPRAPMGPQSGRKRTDGRSLFWSSAAWLGTFKRSGLPPGSLVVVQGTRTFGVFGISSGRRFGDLTEFRVGPGQFRPTSDSRGCGERCVFS